MNATAVRTSTQAAGATAAGTTNGPSSGTATTGGGPVAAPSQPVLLGERLLPAPAGEPQTLHLSDGSMLVPIARVDASGSRVPLSGGPASLPLRTATLAPTVTAVAGIASAVTGGGAAASPAAPAATPTVPVAGAEQAFEPLGFLYNDRYFKKFHDAGGIDLGDSKAVQERAVRSTFAYLLEEEPNVDDFGVTGVSVRRADPAADADLLRVNPRAHYVIDVHGVQGDGTQRSIPSVMNSDGAVFVDPRINRG